MGRIWKLTTPLRLTSATPQMATSEPATRSEGDEDRDVARVGVVYRAVLEELVHRDAREPHADEEQLAAP